MEFTGQDDQSEEIPQVEEAPEAEELEDGDISPLQEISRTEEGNSSPLQEFSGTEEGDTNLLQEFGVREEGDILLEGELQLETAPDDRAWYVVHCYSGYENKVRYNLEQRIETMGMKDKIFDVVVPTEEEIEVKEGKRRTVERRVFPGYILVNMILSEESWYVVRNTPGVTGFVGMGNQPTPLRPEEVAQIIKRMEAEAPRIKVTFKPGERVRIIDGPFNDFRGTVAEIDMERAKVRVMVNFFGRETPVELDFLQVEKS